jgi:hypothetical protein
MTMQVRRGAAKVPYKAVVTRNGAQAMIDEQ